MILVKGAVASAEEPRMVTLVLIEPGAGRGIVVFGDPSVALLGELEPGLRVATARLG